jgi:hypothetical protein
MDYNENGWLKCNREDRYSHMKISRNGKLNIIEDLKEQFNENIYLVLAKSAQEKLLHHGT